MVEAEKSHDLPSTSWRPRRLVVKFNVSCRSEKQGSEGRRKKLCVSSNS
jgi:hypothetical protein